MTRTALVLSLVLFLPGIVYSEVWQGRPIAGQVVGNNSISTGNLHTAALFFEVAHTRATLSFSGEVAGVGLYCGVAGRNGALIWHSGSSPFTETEIVNNELTSTSPAPECDASINNLVSHRAAAEKRLLYVEYEYGGEMRRGQLWPRATGLSDYGHFVEARPSAYQNHSHN